MALQGLVSLNSGIDMTSAYLMVTHVDMNIVPGDVPTTVITVLVYKDKESKDSGKVEVTQYTKICTGSDCETYFGDTVFESGGTNPRKQAYTFLKTLSAYSGFIEV